VTSAGLLTRTVIDAGSPVFKPWDAPLKTVAAEANPEAESARILSCRPDRVMRGGDFMTLGSPRTPNIDLASEPVEIEDQAGPVHRHILIRRVLLLVGGLVSFGFLMAILAGTADASTAPASPVTASAASSENTTQPATPAGVGALLSSLRPSVPTVTDTVGSMTALLAAPVRQVSAAVALPTTPLVHAVTPAVDSLLSPVVHPVSGVLASALTPVTGVLTPVTGPLVDAVSPVVRPVTSALGAQPVVAALGGSTRPATLSPDAASPTTANGGAGDAIQVALPAPGSFTGAAEAVTGRSSAARAAATPTEQALRSFDAASIPLVPNRVPAAPSQSLGVAASGTGSSIGGSGGGHATGHAVTDEHVPSVWPGGRWPVWSSRSCARGSCFVHGRDHPR
jgi:hypothetical protein